MVVTKQRGKAKEPDTPPDGQDGEQDDTLQADMQAVAKRCLLAVVTNDMGNARIYERRFIALHKIWQARGHPATSLITEAQRPDRLYLG